MKFYLRKIGFTLTVIAIVLALFDFLLENNLGILLLGLVAILVSKIIK